MKNQKLTGLSKFATEGSAEVLTAEKFQKMVDYVVSDEYHQIEMERMERRAWGEIIAGQALAQGVVTEAEYVQIMMTIAINGGLIVSPRMAKKLEKVDMSKYQKQMEEAEKKYTSR